MSTQQNSNHQDLIATSIIVHESNPESDTAVTDHCSDTPAIDYTIETSIIVHDSPVQTDDVTVINSGVIIHEAAADCNTDGVVINTGIIIHEATPDKRHPKVKQTGIIVQGIVPEPTE